MNADGVAERAAGQWMLDIRQALDGMLARHGDTLLAQAMCATDAHDQSGARMPIPGRRRWRS